MGRTELLLGGLLTLLTASSSPWWWNKLFPDTPTASASALPAPAPSPSQAASPTTAPASDAVLPSEPSAVTPQPDPAPLESVDALESADCKGKWFLQMAAGEDREGLRGVTDRIRKAGGAFAQAAIYTSDSGNYRVVVGCFERVFADQLRDEFISKELLENKPLVTQGQSLLAKVY